MIFLFYISKKNKNYKLNDLGKILLFLPVFAILFQLIMISVFYPEVSIISFWLTNLLIFIILAPEWLTWIVVFYYYYKKDILKIAQEVTYIGE